MAHRIRKRHQYGLFWESSYNPEDMTFIQDKKVLLCVKNVFLHRDNEGLAKKAELGSEQHCPHLFQTVSVHYYFLFPTGHPVPVWFGMMHCSPSLALIMKCLFFTKLPLTEKNYFLFFFLLLVSAFGFFQKRNQFKNHIEGLPQWYSG